MYFLKSVKFVCYLALFLFVIVFLGGGGASVRRESLSFLDVLSTLCLSTKIV